MKVRDLFLRAADDAAIERRRGLFRFTRWRLSLLLRSPHMLWR